MALAQSPFDIATVLQDFYFGISDQEVPSYSNRVNIQKKKKQQQQMAESFTMASAVKTFRVTETKSVSTATKY